MESAPFFTPDSMVLSFWALPQPNLCILRVEKTARFLNQRSDPSKRPKCGTVCQNKPPKRHHKSSPPPQRWIPKGRLSGV